MWGSPLDVQVAAIGEDGTWTGMFPATGEIGRGFEVVYASAYNTDLRTLFIGVPLPLPLPDAMAISLRLSRIHSQTSSLSCISMLAIGLKCEFLAGLHHFSLPHSGQPLFSI